MKLTLTATAALLACAMPAMAQQSADWYATLGYSNYSLDDADIGAGQLRLGANINQYFGAEVEAAFGITTEDVGFADVDLNRELGVFATARYPVSEQFELFGRLGYVDVELEASAGGLTATDNEGAVAAGVGANFFFAPQHGVRLGYTYLDYDESADQLEIAYVFRFGR